MIDNNCTKCGGSRLVEHIEPDGHGGADKVQESCSNCASQPEALEDQGHQCGAMDIALARGAIEKNLIGPQLFARGKGKDSLILLNFCPWCGVSTIPGRSSRLELHDELVATLEGVLDHIDHSTASWLQVGLWYKTARALLSRAEAQEERE